MRRVLVILVALSLFAAACGDDDSGDVTTAPTTSSGDTTATTPTTVDDATTTSTTTAGGDDFTPGTPLPADFPVFPGAVMWSDFAAGPSHNYLFNTTGSAYDIVEFFAASFPEVGLEVTETFADNEEFGVVALIPGSSTSVAVYFLDDGLDDVNPLTPGRGYGISIDLAAWEAR